MASMFGFVILICIFMSSEKLLSDAELNDESSKFYEGDNDYGFIEVREGVFLFWWLYYAGGDKATAFEKPLIIWIQGGPGNPASGMGNFMEIGPQNLNLNTRPLSWVHKRNVLFIDSPVGTGFSYCKNPESFVKDDHELVNDLISFMKKLLIKIPQFETIPTHIFSQSYGGKIAPRFARYIYNEVKVGKMKMNLRSVGIGSAIVSPKHTAKSYPKKLFSAGLVDTIGLKNIIDCSLQAISFLEEKDYESTNYLMMDMQNSAPSFEFFNLYNMLENPVTNNVEVLLELMNGKVKSALSDVMTNDVPPYQYAIDEVYDAMNNKMMEPGIQFVKELLTETDITVVVYGGQLDLITPLSGSLEWANSLEWSGAQEFRKAKRHPIHGHRNGHYKSFERLSMWWIYKAGHSVGDNLEAMEHILKVVVDGEKQPEEIWDPRLL